MGALQFVVAALAAGLVGYLHDGTARPMALVILLCGLSTVVLGLYSAQQPRRQLRRG